MENKVKCLFDYHVWTVGKYFKQCRICKQIQRYIHEPDYYYHYPHTIHRALNNWPDKWFGVVDPDEYPKLLDVFNKFAWCLEQWHVDTQILAFMKKKVHE